MIFAAFRSLNHDTMKRLFSLILLVSAFSAASAQSTPQAREAVSRIRQLYAGAKEEIAMIQDIGIPLSDMTITYNYMAPAIGPVSSTDRLWYRIKDRETEDSFEYYYYPLFATRHYNVTVRDVYEEYLYDDENECLVFFYYREQWPDGGELIEERYYWDENGELVHHIGSDDYPEFSAAAVGNRFVQQLDVMTISL